MPTSLSYFQNYKDSTKRSSADWTLDPDELEAAFSNKTKAIIINTPNNPLGKVIIYTAQLTSI